MIAPNVQKAHGTRAEYQCVRNVDSWGVQRRASLEEAHFKKYRFLKSLRKVLYFNGDDHLSPAEWRMGSLNGQQSHEEALGYNHQ